MKILAIAGALRRASTNRGMIRAAARLRPEDVDLSIAEIADLPLYDMDLDPSGGDASGAPNPTAAAWPPAVARLRAEFAAADAVLVAVGVNNVMTPPALSNALAWLSRPELDGDEKIRLLKGKTFGLMSSGGGRAGADGREEFAKSLGILGAKVIDESIDVVFFGDDFDRATGDVVGPELEVRIRSLVELLVKAAA